ncbi:MAG: hypothetical protein ACWIPJ_06200 [Polaribacter sp.]
MGTLKRRYYRKFKASSLTEILIATIILVLIFAISLVTLNNIMMSSVRKDTQTMETKVEKLIYQYKNKQLKIPVSYTEGKFTISIRKIAQNEIQFIEFSITNSNSKKTISKKQLFYENE